MTNIANDDDLIALLPWYVNGTLSADEQQQVEDLLARSEDAKSELKILQNLQSHVQTEWQQPAPGELGWRRLQKILKDQAEIQTPNLVSKPQSSWNRFFAAAAVLVICVQLGFIWVSNTDDTSTQLLSGDPAVQQIDGALYRLVIKPDVSWSAVETFLFDINAQIVEGPSALGVITIVVDQQAAANADPNNVLTQLQTSAVIEHAQPVIHE